MDKNSVGNALKEKLFIDRKNGGLLLDDAELSRADAFCEDYKAF